MMTAIQHTPEEWKSIEHELECALNKHAHGDMSTIENRQRIDEILSGSGMTFAEIAEHFLHDDHMHLEYNEHGTTMNKDNED